MRLEARPEGRQFTYIGQKVGVRRGRIIVVGVCRHDDVVLPRVAIRKELLLQFVLGYTERDFRLSFDLLRSPGFAAREMITSRVSFADLPAAFESLRKPNAHGKILLQPSKN